MEGLAGEGECIFYHPIKNNNVGFFKDEQAAIYSKEKILKKDCHWFSTLFISYQVRQFHRQYFLKYENQSTPASLSNVGKLHTFGIDPG